MRIKLILYSFLWGLSAHAQFENDHSLPYDSCTFITTHNSYNVKSYGLKRPNQYLTIQEQLDAGVRAFMLDVYADDKDSIWCYHGYPFMGRVSFQRILKPIQEYMTKDSSVVITILLESYVRSKLIEDEFKQAGLYNLLYKKDTAAWPRLAEMIKMNKRLVVFSGKKENCNIASQLNYVWDYFVETPYAVKRVKKMPSKLGRGNKNNDLFLMNHFVYSRFFGTASKRKSSRVNQYDFLLKRMSKIEVIYQRKVNFIALDFYEAQE